MPSIAVMATKGGVGKTLLAVNFAVLAGPEALLVDLDEQRSAANWWQGRTTEAPDAVEGRLAEAVKVVKEIDRRRPVIIDTGPGSGHDDIEGARLLAPLVDLVAIPTRTGMVDLKAIARLVGIVRGVGAKGVIIINAVQAARGDVEVTRTKDTRTALAALGLPICPTAIDQRFSLSDAFGNHQAIVEFDPGDKAAEQVREVWRWVDDQARA